MAEIIYTKNAPDAIGPYSQAVKVGTLVFTSGQIAINPASGAVEATTIEEQTHQVCKNLSAILTEAGTSIPESRMSLMVRDTPSIHQLTFSGISDTENEP